MINLYFDADLNQAKNGNHDYHVCLSHSIDKSKNNHKSFVYHPNLDVVNNGLENYVLLFGSLVHVDVELLINLKYTKKCKILYWSTEDPYENKFIHKFASFIDFYFTNDFGFFHQISSKTESFFLPLATCSECGFNTESLPTISKTIFPGNAYGKRVNLFLSLPTNILDQIDFVGKGWPRHFNVISNYHSPKDLSYIISKYCKVLDIQRTDSLEEENYTFASSTINPRVFMASAIGSSIFSYGSIQDDGKLIPPGLVKFSDKISDLVTFVDSQTNAMREVDKRFLIKHTYDFNTFESRINQILNLIS